MNTQRKLGLVAVLGCAAFLGACSNDDGTPAPRVTDSVPTSASDDSAGLVAYLKQLVAFTGADSDLLEPVDIGGFTAPTQVATEIEDPKEI